MPRPAMNSTSVATIGWTDSLVTSKPLKTPHAAAASTGSTNASAMPPGPGIFRNSIGASAPEIAIDAPTDRSMPPVATTSVIPMPTITIVTTCVMLTLKVCSDQKCGVKIRLKSTIASNTITSRCMARCRHFFTVDAAVARDVAASGIGGVAWVCNDSVCNLSAMTVALQRVFDMCGLGGFDQLRLAFAAVGDGVHDGGIAHVGAVQFGDGAAVADHHRAVGDRCQLLEFGGGQQHGEPRIAQFT